MPSKHAALSQFCLFECELCGSERVCRLRNPVSSEGHLYPSVVPAGSWSTVAFCCQNSVLRGTHISRVFWLPEARAFAERTHQMCLRSAGLCSSMGALHAGHDTDSILPFQRRAFPLQSFARIDPYPAVLPGQSAVSAASCGPEGALWVGAESSQLTLPRVVLWKPHR